MSKKDLNTESILREIKIALSDVFIAKLRKKDDEIELWFPGGQTFVVSVREEKEE